MSRFFSKKSFIEIIKSLFKVILVGWIAFSTVIDNFEEALILVDTSIVTTISYLGRVAAIILAKICAVLILIAFLDFLFVKWELEEKMKMTKQELKEEYKESEGDPHIKAQIRSIQQEMARKRMMAEVPKADVIITNPTHISVAIRYNSKEMTAPVIIAKGADLVAMKIREIARKHEIPIIENPPVARLLHKLDIGENIPEDLFKVVAEILAHVYSSERQDELMELTNIQNTLPAWIKAAFRRSDIVAALGLVSILMIMIIPLPSIMLDLFLSMNITIALLILIISLYTIKATDFSIFPSYY